MREREGEGGRNWNAPVLYRVLWPDGQHKVGVFGLSRSGKQNSGQFHFLEPGIFLSLSLSLSLFFTHSLRVRGSNKINLLSSFPLSLSLSLSPSLSLSLYPSIYLFLVFSQ